MDEPKYTPITGETQKKRVCYFYDNDIGGFHYSAGHYMKPTRIRMCHSLVMNYGLYKKMEIFRAKPATKKEMQQFHAEEYIDFLYKVNPSNQNSFGKEQGKFNVGDDCPVFEGLSQFCAISAGGSIEGAARLCRGKCDIAINWSGGLHHAKKGEASGFCYVNDIVLGILELLRFHERVLYIDIDAHHGDGVEEAFYLTDRVMTCSFHKYGEFFPGTGELRDIGVGKGKYHCVNVPLRDGISDENYKSIFEPVVQAIMDNFNPGAIVLQCGTDSLARDKIASLNLSMRGHANCVRFVKTFNKPLLLLGGGGYTMRNVSRTWAYETGIANAVEMAENIPVNEYYEYFGPEYKLDVKSSETDDLNTRSYLDLLKRRILENIRQAGGPPSVQMQDVPQMKIDKSMADLQADEELIPPNTRRPRSILDGRVQHDGNLSDSDDEGEGGRRDHNTSIPSRLLKKRPPMPVDEEAEEEDEAGGQKRFRMGVATAAAGPSEHTTVARVLTKQKEAGDEADEADDEAADFDMDVESEEGAPTRPTSTQPPTRSASLQPSGNSANDAMDTNQ
ncbi:histone deacetylase [Cylindrobasidium torrendii FP15055 ss-10]|uniref:histone deacetylase n=1 Tax=Cylindrobasidium torrendii FP15055 ss-10 TaxID=1314674 RepID=A0A0D7B9Q3_9AGAR|nr:histone deacetylase [Cylindrobasidium torrendii FP15055 ss-10]